LERGSNFLGWMKGMPVVWQRAIDLIVAMLVIMTTVAYAAPASTNYSDLVNLTTSTEDSRITAEDLAFLLATHNFDAVPKDGFVVVKINGAAYKMVPNGPKPGLADITIMS